MLPLHELIAAVVGNAVSSKGVWSEYDSFIKKFGNEFDVLLNVSLDELKEVNEKVAEMFLRNREGGIAVEPGFDGEYGKIVEREKQTKLF